MTYEYAIDNQYRPESWLKLPEDELKESPYVIIRNKHLVASKYLKDLPDDNIYVDEQPNNLNTYVVSKSPEFNWEDFKWVKPNTVYPIQEVLENYQR